MMTSDIVREIAGPAGALETLIDRPAEAPRAAVVLGHPLPTQGGTMHSRPVYQAAKALARIGCEVLRFNFRGVGASPGAFDEGRGERDDFRAALDFMAARHPDLPLWAAGYSFGSWIALEVGAADPRVALLLAIAPPVNHYEFTAVRESAKPKLFLHGGHDQLTPMRTMRRFYGELAEPKDLIEIDGADHFFDGMTVELGDAVADLMEEMLDPRSS